MEDNYIKNYKVESNKDEHTRSRAVALNFWSKNAFGSIWPGGLPMPNRRNKNYSTYKRKLKANKEK